MTNKLEIDRELAQKVDDLLYIMTGHDSYPYPRLVHKYGKEWWTPINEMRAEICTLLAAPVVERQEPVAWVDPHSLVRFSANERMWVRTAASLAENRTNGYTQPLYAEQPAPVEGLRSALAECIKQRDALKAAPVVVSLPSYEEVRVLVTKAAREADLIPGANYYTAAEIAAEALLDKVKELNQ